MKYLYNADKEKIPSWVTNRIKAEEKNIQIYKEAIKRLNAMLPYARKASEGVYGDLFPHNFAQQAEIDIKSLEEQLKESEKQIKQGNDFIKEKYGK